MTDDQRTVADPLQDGDLGLGLVKTPLHEQVKERILRRIILGTWGEGHVLPPETELATQFGVSYGTIRRAMTDLTYQGVIMRRRKTGTVVTGRTPQHSLAQFYRYYRLHSIDGGLTTSDTHLLETCHRSATVEEAERLEIPAGAPVAFMVRARTKDSRVIMIDRITVALSLAPDFPARVEDAPILLYTWLLEKHRLRIAAVRERLAARLATPEDLGLMQLPTETPVALLDIDTVSYDSMNRPLAATRHAALTDEYCYINEIR